jgi:hypothetical protein
MPCAAATVAAGCSACRACVACACFGTLCTAANGLLEPAHLDASAVEKFRSCMVMIVSQALLALWRAIVGGVELEFPKIEHL